MKVALRASEPTDSEVLDLSQVTLAVIAGGQGERMGLPKARLRLEQQPILEWLLRKISWPGPTLLVTVPALAHPPGSGAFDAEVSDPLDGLGPLRGILTAVQHSSTPMVAVVTVDMPCVRTAILAFLVKALAARSETKGVMCRAAIQAGRVIEPFPSAFRRSAQEPIAVNLAANQRSVQALALLPGFLALESPPDWPADIWTNLNTPAEFAAFEATHRTLISKEDA
ncbi:MAG: hypothetical protein NVS9B4_22030 [Candidatus Acidiferrum sp.]